MSCVAAAFSGIHLLAPVESVSLQILPHHKEDVYGLLMKDYAEYPGLIAYGTWNCALLKCMEALTKENHLRYKTHR